MRELVVVKKSGRRVPFDRDKLARSFEIALRKRPVDSDRIERMVTGIVRQLESQGESEIASERIGELVMEGLRSLDSVAYVRFASVYRNFREARDFETLIDELNTDAPERDDSAPPARGPGEPGRMTAGPLTGATQRPAATRTSASCARRSRWAGAGRARPRPIPPSARSSCATGSSSGAARRSRAGVRTPKPSRIMDAGEKARGATIYVSLEPCSHFGRTPPCAQTIISSGIARVVSALEDPDLRVAGRGHKMLRDAGIEVSEGVCAHEARRANLGHILRVSQKRPMVTLKLAETADGFAAGGAHDPRLAITGAAANNSVHVMRAMHDAIMVGAGTVRADDPLMTVRLPGLENRRPLRVVLDTGLSISPRSRLVATAREFPVLVICGPKASPDAQAELESHGVQVVALPPRRRRPARSLRGAAIARPSAASRACSARAGRPSAAASSWPAWSRTSCCSRTRSRSAARARRR